MVDDAHDWQAPLEFDGVILAQHSATPPERTDDAAAAAPELRLRPTRVKAKWELLTHAEMREVLNVAQAHGDDVICAGCGRGLPDWYMELDHNRPRADGGPNTIDNRILLCGPGNGLKGAKLTLSGLVAENRRRARMINADLARLSASKATAAAECCKVDLS